MENLENAIVEIKEKMPGLKLLENEPMSSHCSFRIGGPVRALAAPKDVTGLSKLCHLLKTHHISPLAKLASFAQQNGLAGLEFASGIPGTVGGGVRMNAGAYGGELKDAVESVVFYFLPDQGLYEMMNENCKFAYRSSIFQQMNAAILSAVFRLQPGDKAEISAKMRELNERRRDKQPLDMPSAGSAFKRPEGHYAAALIEEVGLKGYSVGGAQVSEKHSGFVVNTGGATSCTT